MMKKLIPQPVISVVANCIATMETHATLDSLFAYADAPGEPPVCSKPAKALEWLRRINKESDEPYAVLGRLVEGYIESPDTEPKQYDDFDTVHRRKYKKELKEIFARYGLNYTVGGIITDGNSISSVSLQDAIKHRNMPAIEAEFKRALEHVNNEPKESVSAACNILESVCKIYIADENLPMPAKQDLQSVWKIVKNELGLDPKLIEDADLQRILSGLFSITDGIGAFRTHASTAHGAGRKSYNVKPRHARLAIHSAHTLVLFILETWDELRSKK
jgi:hypothetical protein